VVGWCRPESVPSVTSPFPLVSPSCLLSSLPSWVPSFPLPLIHPCPLLHLLLLTCFHTSYLLSSAFAGPSLLTILFIVTYNNETSLLMNGVIHKIHWEATRSLFLHRTLSAPHSLCTALSPCATLSSLASAVHCTVVVGCCHADYDNADGDTVDEGSLLGTSSSQLPQNERCHGIG